MVKFFGGDFENQNGSESSVPTSEVVPVLCKPVGAITSWEETFKNSDKNHKGSRSKAVDIYKKRKTSLMTFRQKYARQARAINCPEFLSTDTALGQNTLGQNTLGQNTIGQNTLGQYCHLAPGEGQEWIFLCLNQLI
jgi:hypothetical protein